MKHNTKFPANQSSVLLPGFYSIGTVTVTGAVLMILELTASRTLAPAIGTSLISWTGIIGTIMAWLSVGYVLGGRLADADNATESVGKNRIPLLVAGGAYAILISMLSAHLIITGVSFISDPYIRVLCAASALFAVPTTIIGMIFPYTVKLSIRSLANSGTVVGLMYTYSTVGSILGTFFGGFYLLGTFGNMKVLLLLSVSLSILSVMHSVYDIKNSRMTLILALVGICVGMALWFTPSRLSLPGTITDIDSRYNRIWVIDTRFPGESRMVRQLKTGPGAQSSMYLANGADLSAPYLRFFRIAYRIIPDMASMLVIGGGAFTFPSDAVKRTVKTHIDVVEIDPAMEVIAQKYFSYTPDSRITSIHDDARIYIQRMVRGTYTPAYDAVFIDAFDHAYAIPSHLTTREFIGEMRNVLSPGGVVVVNIISAITGPKGKFLRAQYSTYKSLFSRVSVFQVQPELPADALQNLVLIARDKPLFVPGQLSDPEISAYMSHEYTRGIHASEPVLTDDFSPTEQYLAF